MFFNFFAEIGRYAFHCGNSKAIQHFSDKLQLSIKESTVRKFKKAWIQRNGDQQVQERKIERMKEQTHEIKKKRMKVSYGNPVTFLCDQTRCQKFYQIKGRNIQTEAHIFTTTRKETR